MQHVSYPNSLRRVAVPQALQLRYLTIPPAIAYVNTMSCLLRLHDAPPALTIGTGVTHGLVAAMVARAR